ncbi:MAG TPA: hypothetical protein PKW76_16550 [bacterium]|jgi:hypothetical protein|nr:hypothetical protein [bacterium]HPG47284.1 hypothetical protein [bacterium]HPM99510.1 hypothetical protein [bacterium]
MPTRLTPLASPNLHFTCAQTHARETDSTETICGSERLFSGNDAKLGDGLWKCLGDLSHPDFGQYPKITLFKTLRTKEHTAPIQISAVGVACR